MTYVRRPTHFALGSSNQSPDSPCGYISMWHRGLNYTRKIEQVTCQRCRAWLKKEREKQVVKP